MRVRADLPWRGPVGPTFVDLGGVSPPSGTVTAQCHPAASPLLTTGTIQTDGAFPGQQGATATDFRE